jgi:hypothetical protein
MVLARQAGLGRRRADLTMLSACVSVRNSSPGSRWARVERVEMPVPSSRSRPAVFSKNRTDFRAVSQAQLASVEGDTDPRPRFSCRPVGKRPSMPSDSEQRPLRSPEPSRGGPDIDAAVQNAESDTQAEGVHRSAPPGQAVGDSRLEQMREVDTSGERAEPDIPEGPLPGEVGAGGAQRIVGARISDRVAGGAERPAGPPFDDDGSGAGASPGPD